MTTETKPNIRGLFTCPRCGRTSYHPTDVAEGYCGACHDWTRHAGARPGAVVSDELAAVARTANAVVAATAARDAAIVAAVVAGNSQRRVAEYAGLTHPTVAGILRRYIDVLDESPTDDDFDDAYRAARLSDYTGPTAADLAADLDPHADLPAERARS